MQRATTHHKVACLHVSDEPVPHSRVRLQLVTWIFKFCQSIEQRTSRQTKSSKCFASCNEGLNLHLPKLDCRRKELYPVIWSSSPSPVSSYMVRRWSNSSFRLACWSFGIYYQSTCLCLSNDSIKLTTHCAANLAQGCTSSTLHVRDFPTWIGRVIMQLLAASKTTWFRQLNTLLNHVQIVRL